MSVFGGSRRSKGWFTGEVINHDAMMSALKTVLTPTVPGNSFESTHQAQGETDTDVGQEQNTEESASLVDGVPTRRPYDEVVLDAVRGKGLVNFQEIGSDVAPSWLLGAGNNEVIDFTFLED